MNRGASFCVRRRGVVQPRLWGHREQEDGVTEIAVSKKPQTFFLLLETGMLCL